MKCPYRKKIRVSPDGVCRVTEVDYMDCLKESCPYYGAIAFNATRGSWVMGCRKAAKVRYGNMMCSYEVDISEEKCSACSAHEWCSRYESECKD